MLAIAGGLATALVFAIVTLCNSRSSRVIGPGPLLGWIMVIGLVILSPFVVAGGIPAGLDARAAGWMAVAGGGDIVGLRLAYAGLAVGKVGLVAPIVATQGAVAATIAVVAGERLAAGAGWALSAIAIGVVLASAARESASDSGADGQSQRRAAAYAIGSAVAIGFSLYAIARVSVDLPVVWALLPSRVLGFLSVTLPLAARSELRMVRRALPLVLVAGMGEILGFALFGVASRYGISVTSVLSSLFAAIAAIGAYVLFGERLGRVQLIGIVVVVVSVAALSGLQAA